MSISGPLASEKNNNKKNIVDSHFRVAQNVKKQLGVLCTSQSVHIWNIKYHVRLRRTHFIWRVYVSSLQDGDGQLHVLFRAKEKEQIIRYQSMIINSQCSEMFMKLSWTSS